MSASQNSPFVAGQRVHLTGIKGVGMTALALCLQDLGLIVSGSDVADEYVTQDILRQRGIVPQVDFSDAVFQSPLDLLIYTGAHGGLHNPQVVTAQKLGLPVMSQAQAVGALMVGKLGISVCGVGGKTSTSAMIATILDYAGFKPSYCIGVGKVLNLQFPGRLDSGRHFVAEADEYLVSPGADLTPRFMHQKPSVIVCTNVAHDHPDAYPDLNATKTVFANFFASLPQDGLLVLNGNSGPLRQIKLGSQSTLWYGLSSPHNDWWVANNFVGEGKQMVQINSRQSETYQFTLSVPGRFNALNALAAFIVSRYLGLKPSTILEALQLFRGSLRRFEKVGEWGSVLLYDDYAHHPSQIFATLQAARQWLPLYKIVVVFQPHTYSRTKILLNQFAKSFTYADQVIITDIYASAREKPDPTISGAALAAAVAQHHPATVYVPQPELPQYLKAHLKDHDALFTMGAGDIYQLHQALKHA